MDNDLQLLAPLSVLHWPTIVRKQPILLGTMLDGEPTPVLVVDIV